jgi:hypothetical protein
VLVSGAVRRESVAIPESAAILAGVVAAAAFSSCARLPLREQLTDVAATTPVRNRTGIPPRRKVNMLLLPARCIIHALLGNSRPLDEGILRPRDQGNAVLDVTALAINFQDLS